MTDSDPAPTSPRPQPRRPRADQRPDRQADATAARASAPDSPRHHPVTSGEPATGQVALRDRWWWSSTLSIVMGLAVIGYQWEPLRSGDALGANWLVAAVGAAVAVWGAVRLVRAARAR